MYAYTEETDDDKKERLYEEIDRLYEQIPKFDTTIILGDFNVKIGKEKYLKVVVGKFTLHDRTNKNGQMWSTLTAPQILVIMSTKFEHKREEKITSKIPGKEDGIQIDHVLKNR